jgi:transcriptional regulator with XRE-family HTH domain
MKTNINSDQLGEIIKRFRMLKNISQEELAKALDVPRTAISQIENGGRDLSFVELQKLLNLFEVSFDEFVGFGAVENKADKNKQKKVNKKIKFSPEKFKQLLLYILQRCGGKPNVGETFLYKLLYFCDFNFFEIYEKPLTGMKYKKMKFGPVPDQVLYFSIIEEMKESGLIERISKPYINDTIQTRYLNFAEADLSVFGEDIEKMRKVTDSVIERLSGLSARQIEDFSHNDFPWFSHEENSEIDYGSVFNRSGEYANRDYEKEFLGNAALDVSKDLPALSRKEVDYYMSLPDKR